MGILVMRYPNPKFINPYKPFVFFPVKEHKMQKIYLTLVFLMLFAFVTCGCESIPHQREQILSDNWGKSFQAIKTNHIINPDAGMDEKTVEGIDGVASKKAIDKYHKSFDEKPPAQITNINISGIGSN
jgi:hypothetical protein